ncbi:uncharacterized adenine-specific methylase [Candidatus Blochmanniella vafra str. BVAF]|uniref:Uncharacterized adenine-specific methylase n=1 Tax=Blochmanniella vafra (strain BVAF) TaxID=859654 RepID=E8Q762_BLOVB|nr:50S ribosomal protein L3 N(5)-glutamine methyltransferase [Candidatus Blochmannia vafer]ADV33886.1 uncharacterized adenine-specific methylase [Candidatus Blochmannia vafer str. BVAF]
MKTYTILDILRWSISQFNSTPLYYGHGTNNVWDEALHLVLSSINLPIDTPTEIFFSCLSKKERALIIKLVNLRVQKRIPVPYLTNKAWFCNLEFYVNNQVFIPRSPIGELIMSNFHDILPTPPKHILDMCTGSGCIAIAIAMIMYPHSEIDAVDLSIKALQIAEYNIKLYNLENQIIPIHSNLFKNIPKFKKYDLIVINPPYVNKADICNLPEEYLHEPILSLSANCNGLEIIHQIFIQITDYLNTNGVLVCEVGNTQNELKKYYENIPFHWFTLNNGGTGVFALTYQQLLSLNKNYT